MRLCLESCNRFVTTLNESLDRRLTNLLVGVLKSLDRSLVTDLLQNYLVSSWMFHFGN